MKTAAPNLVVTRNVTVKTLLEGLPIHGRGELEGARRTLFHKLARRFFYDLAIQLRLSPKDFDVSNYYMGAETSGEIWLHTTRLFLQMSQDYIREPFSSTSSEYIKQGPVKVRRCFGIRDFPKADVQIYWMPLITLQSVEETRDWVLNFMAGSHSEENNNGEDNR